MALFWLVGAALLAGVAVHFWRQRQDVRDGERRQRAYEALSLDVQLQLLKGHSPGQIADDLANKAILFGEGWSREGVAAVIDEEWSFFEQWRDGKYYTPTEEDWVRARQETRARLERLRVRAANGIYDPDLEDAYD